MDLNNLNFASVWLKSSKWLVLGKVVVPIHPTQMLDKKLVETEGS